MTDRTVTQDASSARWHDLSADDTLAQIGSRPDGLTDSEAGDRLAQFGPNEVETDRGTPWWRLLLHQFTDPLIYILLAAAIITLLLRDYTDTGVILAVVVLNAVIGFTQEYRAHQAMRALQKLSAPKAEVLRDGRAREIASREVVPGDIVLLTSGARVPADLRLTDARHLEVDESMLTGESTTVRKDAHAVIEGTPVAGDQINMAFLGTIVARGRARGVAVRTGPATELGRIAAAVRELGPTATPLQLKMERLGHWIAFAVVGLSVVTAGIGLAVGLSLGEMVLTAAALAVATIPEGLPIVVTVTLALGVRRMARRRAIIRSLPAVETLGSTTVIGSDKTGTLTKNEMSVRAVWAGGEMFGVDEGGLSADLEQHRALHATLLAGLLANEAKTPGTDDDASLGDPTEVALLRAAGWAGLDVAQERRHHTERDLLPFEPERKFMATLNDGPAGRRVWLKGAPEVILSRCDRMATTDGDAPIDADAIRAAAAELAQRGLRVLAMAFGPREGDGIKPDALSGLVFTGLQGMEDPVRPEAIDAVASAHAAGIRVLMLTGDHVDTARAIGKQLGLGANGETRAVEGAALETMADEELDRTLDDTAIYARVAPEHKLRIVQRLKHKGEIVAVTGDGVNDAPALRAAHLGVAMGKSGTDVAREASDMVLADDNFATITAAVEEGRVVFSNIRKVTFFLLSTGVAMPIAILATLFMGYPLPFVPAQILWINLVTNGLQDVALAFEPAEPGLLKRRRRDPHEGVITLPLLRRLGAVGVLIAAGTAGVFWWNLELTGNLEYARTMAMTQMVVFQFFHVFNSRSLDQSIFRISPFSNRFLFVSLIAAALAHVGALYWTPLQRIFRTVPLDQGDWTLLATVGTSVILGGEVDKWWNRRRGRTLG